MSEKEILSKSEVKKCAEEEKLLLKRDDDIFENGQGFKIVDTDWTIGLVRRDDGVIEIAFVNSIAKLRHDIWLPENSKELAKLAKMSQVQFNKI